jgi:glycosyltransferase involved in cell wall biosynthesis
LKKKEYGIKFVLFGIGVSASYDKRYDREKKVGWLLKNVIQRADAAIFYDSYPTIKYSAMGVTPEKMFVAHNTVVGNMLSILPLADRNSILFIGSLYKQKGIHLLLEAYQLLLSQGGELPILNIIGDGPEKESVIRWIDKHQLNDKIFVLGSITEEEAVKPYFSRALCCVSPGQAGLSVQKSFSYGVPFVTSYYPVSGGEFTSIIEGVTGFYYDGSVNDLAVTIKKAIGHPELANIFENCSEFYQRFRSPKFWVKGFTDALQYVLQ